MPRARTRPRGKKFVTPEVMISERPAEVDDRAVPGHWEGDLIIGLNQSAIGTLVERTSRFTMLLHLPRMEGHGTPGREERAAPRWSRGRGSTGRHRRTQRSARATPSLADLGPRCGDGPARPAAHRHRTRIYFCDPHSPWQRGSNENTNGLLRQYFPKGTDLSRWTTEDLAAVASTLNTRPRKTLEWRTPAEVLAEHLASAA